MRIRKIKATTSFDSRRKVVRASKTVSDMLDAFEAKLANFGIESATDVKCTTSGDYEAEEIMRSERETTIYGEDYHEKYSDVGGGFGEPNEIYSLAEIKQYWNENNMGDPSLREFSSFRDWWKETRYNYLTEA